MANEHVLVYETQPAIPFTVSNTTGIEKGTVLTMTDPFTAVANNGNKSVPAGIAKVEKIASDGVTKLAVYRGGIFKATASGSITVGNGLVTDFTGNKLVSCASTANLSGSIIVGISLETASDGETFLYELRPMYTNAGALN
jgi:hypothetical protein